MGVVITFLQCFSQTRSNQIIGWFRLMMDSPAIEEIPQCDQNTLFMNIVCLKVTNCEPYITLPTSHGI